MERKLLLALVCAHLALGASWAEVYPLADIGVAPPEGWTLTQEGTTRDRSFLAFARGDQTVHVYVKGSGSLDMKGTFASGGSTVSAGETNETHGPLKWRKLDASRSSLYVTGFQAEFRKRVYFGYSRARSASEAKAAAKEFLENFIIRVPGRSLTGEGYGGKKFYLGWGAAMNGDMASMHNEVKYDVLHTHDVFTKEIGGGYLGNQLIGPSTASGSAIRRAWDDIQSKATEHDMYVQYSSGHGSYQGLAVGLGWSEIRDSVLELPVKEVIVFTMACHSGNLVNSFDQKKSTWQNWPSEGRTLFVMASSRASETSSTGPGTDQEEPGGKQGSAGSAFGHALWKSLIGYSDGYVDGVKDGFVSLEEIRDYAIYLTKKIGRHTPQVTGAYRGDLIMNRVPSKEMLARLSGGTEGLSDEAIMRRVEELDRVLEHPESAP